MGWLLGYRRTALRGDGLGALTAWALIVPECVAYAQIAEQSLRSLGVLMALGNLAQTEDGRYDGHEGFPGDARPLRDQQRNQGRQQGGKSNAVLGDKVAHIGSAIEMGRTGNG
ncbi:hypothetical protein [Streptomyces sp. NPDC059402]|uniref:hypothetical protein n=1 Tax=Streptomyces sp. NPDC059402 TaxID=3346822 RepID=UPI0036C34067